MRNKNLILATGVLILSTVGCSGIGNAPPGASIAQVKASFEAKPLEERVKEINDMSIPEGDKKETIKRMYAKEGKTPPDNLLAPTGSKAPLTSH